MSKALESVKGTVRRYPKTLSSVGLLTTCGILFYEKHRIARFISKYANSNNNDNNQDKRRPDYIYIKYHIYRESMRKLQQEEEEGKKWISVITHPIGKWWKAVKHSVAWRLLSIAQTGSQHERLKAVHQMASIDHLKDWDFRHLAQMCDARTAVSLARSGADKRWFVPVHMRGIIKNPKIVLSETRDMLNCLRPNSCVDHFFARYFPEQDLHDVVEEFYTRQTIPITVEENVLLKEIVAFLHHITKDLDAAEKIVKSGGLTQLMELCKIFSKDNETLSTLCKVLANCSLVKDCVEHFFVTGWITMLAEWQKCPDLRLQVISAKTMANLDHDDPNRSEYPPNIYPLYPRRRTSSKPKADIVFIHGLLGGVFITWRQKDRTSTELGLYGKNAFYTNETDEVFLVGEQPKISFRKRKITNVNGSTNVNELLNEKNKVFIKEKETGIGECDAILKASEKLPAKQLEISDTATKEFVEELLNESEINSDWEVVHPDIPISANDDSDGEFSIPGNEWHNENRIRDYTNCWPMEWLPDDFPGVRIIGIDYTSAVTEWASNFAKYCPCEKNQGHINVRAESLLNRISKSDVGKNRPIIWIGHSMGGILTKAMLLKALEDPDEKKQQIAKSTKGIVFLGTPHKGSSIAKWKQHMQVILSPSIEVKEMEENSPMLLAMHERFMLALKNQLKKVNIVSIAEGTPTMLTTFKFPLHIVTENSARIDYGDFYVLKDDHLSLSKPIFRQSFLYKRMLQVIDESIDNMKSKSKPVDQLPAEAKAVTKNSISRIQQQGTPLQVIAKSGLLNYSTNLINLISKLFVDFPASTRIDV